MLYAQGHGAIGERVLGERVLVECRSLGLADTVRPRDFDFSQHRLPAEVFAVFGNATH